MALDIKISQLGTVILEETAVGHSNTDAGSSITPKSAMLHEAYYIFDTFRHFFADLVHSCSRIHLGESLVGSFHHFCVYSLLDLIRLSLVWLFNNRLHRWLDWLIDLTLEAYCENHNLEIILLQVQNKFHLKKGYVLLAEPTPQKLCLVKLYHFC